MKCSFCEGINRTVSLLIIYKNFSNMQEIYFRLHVIFYLHYTYKNSIVKPSDKLIITQYIGGQDEDYALCPLFPLIQNRIITDELTPVGTWSDKAGSRLSLFNGSMQRERPRKTGKESQTSATQKMQEIPPYLSIHRFDMVVKLEELL